MRLFHFNMVKMPSFYPVFSFGMPEAFYWLSLWNFKKETSTSSCGTPDFSFNSFLFIFLSCWWLLPAGTNSFRAASPPDESLGRGKEPFLEKDFSFSSTALLPLFQRLSRLSNPCSMVLRDVAKCPLYRLSEKTCLKLLVLS